MTRRLSSINPSSCGGRYEDGDEGEGDGDEVDDLGRPDVCPFDGMQCGGDCPIGDPCRAPTVPAPPCTATAFAVE